MVNPVIWFKELHEDDRAILGPHAERLRMMYHAGIPMAPGFIIPSSIYIGLLRTNQLPPKIHALLATASYEHADSLHQVATHIRSLIRHTPVSEEFVAAIYKAYTKLGGVFRHATVYVSTSLTGQVPHEPMNWQVHGEANLLEKIQEAWTLPFETNAIAFRHTHHLDQFSTGVAVIVQKHIKAEEQGAMIDGEIRYHTAGKKLNDRQQKQLIAIEQKLTELFNKQQQINWAIEKGKIFILASQDAPVLSTQTTPSTLLFTGEPVMPGIGTGPLRIITNEKDAQKIAPREVILTNHPELPYFPYLSQTRKPAAIIVVPSHKLLLRDQQLLLQNLKHLGIPSIIAKKALHPSLHDGLVVTVHGSKGEVLRGGLGDSFASKYQSTATKVFASIVNLGTDLQKQRPVEGVIYLTVEKLIKAIGIHPHQLIQSGQKQLLTKELSEQLTTLCKTIAPHPVLYKLADLQTSDYHILQDDQQREQHEINPILGYHGATRLLHDPLLDVELEVIASLREERHLQNLHILLPFLRTVPELKELKTLLGSYKLHRSPTCKLWMTVATPASVISLEKFIEAGIDGVSIDFDNLIMLLLGIDKHNHTVSHLFDEYDPAVLWAVEHVIKTAQKHHVISSLIYNYPYPPHDLFKKLVHWGITSISVPANTEESMRKATSLAEQLRMGNISRDQ
jgi:phosphoenolpyruvate synthase/pyruvate phosphate dikinase